MPNSIFDKNYSDFLNHLRAGAGDLAFKSFLQVWDAEGLALNERKAIRHSFVASRLPTLYAMSKEFRDWVTNECKARTTLLMSQSIIGLEEEARDLQLFSMVAGKWNEWLELVSNQSTLQSWIRDGRIPEKPLAHLNSSSDLDIGS